MSVNDRGIVAGFSDEQRRLAQSSLIRPVWPVAARVKAFSTLRGPGGVSNHAFSSFNMGLRSGDEPAAVQMNRELLRLSVDLPSQPYWLNQVHGLEVFEAKAAPQLGTEPVADAAVCFTSNVVLAVLSADCLPILLCNREATAIAAIHAGWRGLSAGVIEQTIEKMRQPGKNLLAWLGPAAGPRAYEISTEVRDAFIQFDAAAEFCFSPIRPGHWLMDIYALARQRLRKLGVQRVFGADYCSISQSEKFYSYRREGQTGRMATMIYLSDS